MPPSATQLCRAAGIAAINPAAVTSMSKSSGFGADLVSFQNTRCVLAGCAAETLAARTLVDHRIARYSGSTAVPTRS